MSITRNGAWLDSVNSPMADEKLAKLRGSIRLDRSLGSDEWVERTPQSSTWNQVRERRDGPGKLCRLE